MTGQHGSCGCEANGLKRYLTGVAIAVTTAILVQSASLIWWAATLTTRVDYLEKHVDAMSAHLQRLDSGHDSHS
jgi:hypothetical protein